MSDIDDIQIKSHPADPSAADELLPLVYDELRRLAVHFLARERPGLTLDATALVHEAYLRLAPSSSVESPRWDGRRHFFAAAAISMRRILVENARRKSRAKRGGGWHKVEASELTGPDEDERLLDLDEALSRLAAEDLQAARVVELHHFAGLGHELVAETLGVSVYLARRKWTYAQAWLRDALKP